MERDELIDFLRASSLGESLSDADLGRLAESGRVRRTDPGEVLLEEGKPGGRLIVILEGQVEIFKSRDDDSRVDLSLLGPGGVVGEVGVILEYPATATVRTLIRSRIFELDHAVFQDLVSEVSPSSQALLLSMARLLAARLQRTSEHALELYLRTEEAGLVIDGATLDEHVDELIALKNELLGGWNL